MKIKRAVKTKAKIKNTECKYCQGACDGLFCTCVGRLDKQLSHRDGPRPTRFEGGVGLVLFRTGETGCPRAAGGA